MEKETRSIILTIGVFVIIVAGCYGALVLYSGSTVPFSSVVSGSMQHDNERSEIGVVDTGDIIITKSVDKSNIVSYVKGLETGDKSFGHYGSVIIYNRGDEKNPVIHRAIVWLDYNQSTNTWSSEELNNIAGKWYCEYMENNTQVIGIDPMNIHGTLHFTDIYGKTPSVNLDSLPIKKSGFLTMGDNPITNTTFDQGTGIINHPIDIDDIKSVAGIEIPWLGSIKLKMNGNTNLENHAPNSIPSLIMEILLIFSLIILIDVFALKKYGKEMDRNINCLKKWKRL